MFVCLFRQGYRLQDSKLNEKVIFITRFFSLEMALFPVIVWFLYWLQVSGKLYEVSDIKII